MGVSRGPGIGAGSMSQRCPGNVGRVAVVGLGTIGAGWAASFAAHRFEVFAHEPVPAYLERGVAMIEKGAAFLGDSGLMPQTSANEILARIRVLPDLADCLEDVDFVQESIVEDYDAKRTLYATMERLLPEACIVASSSSGLLISRLREGTARPDRFVIGHPWNPPYLMPLVEIVAGPSPDESVIARTKEIYEKLEMVPIVVRKEVVGHVGNRLAAALWREAIDLVTKGVATVDDVDKAVQYGPGMRWALFGVHYTYHLGGGPDGIGHFVEHIGPAFESWWQDLACWTSIPANAEQLLSAGIDSAVRGRSYEQQVEDRDRKLAELLSLRRSWGS